MEKVNLHQAKIHLSRLVEVAKLGKEIVIAKSGKPVAKLVPLSRSKGQKPRQKGLLKGKIHMGKDFDQPLLKEIISAFKKASHR